MKQMRYVFALTLLLILTLASSLSFADHERRGRKVEVTITNLTRGQVFSPPIVIIHDGTFPLFTLGAPASLQLYPLAEDGLTDPLTDHIASLHEVFDFVVADAPLAPGHSVTLKLRTRGRFRFVSAAGMLVTTNDAFFAIQDVKVPKKGVVVVYGEAYDAGSEGNSENCAHIPGPPCESASRNADGAEGYVHIHAGIHGIGDLYPATHDWRNPVAAITILSGH
jgi:hypothetical protein